MRIRSRLSERERNARSRLAKLLRDRMLLKGGLVTTNRTVEALVERISQATGHAAATVPTTASTVR